MPRKPGPVFIEEHGGDHYPDLKAVQVDAEELFSSELARVLRSMLESGKLIIRDNVIIPNPEVKDIE